MYANLIASQIVEALRVPMPEISATSAQIVELCSENDADPIAIVGLLSLLALANTDFAKLEYWKRVTERLRSSVALGK